MLPLAGRGLGIYCVATARRELNKNINKEGRIAYYGLLLCH